MMSLMNLLSGILTLDFPLIYLVRDHIMDEAEAKSGQQFERVVAQFKRKHTTTHRHNNNPTAAAAAAGLDKNGVFNTSAQVSDTFNQQEVVSVTTYIQNTNFRRRKHEMRMFFPTLVFSVIPLAVMGALTRFEAGHSACATLLGHAMACIRHIHGVVLQVWGGDVGPFVRLSAKRLDAPNVASGL